MFKHIRLVVAFALGGLTAIGIAAGPQNQNRSREPALLSPAMYKVILENDHLRVLDYHLRPGEKEPMHSHPHGVFVYYFTDADTRGAPLHGETTESHRKAGEVLWREPVTHVAENIGQAEIHQLLVEPKEYCESTGPK